MGPGLWLGVAKVGAGVKSKDMDVQFPNLEPTAREDGNPFPPVLPIPLCPLLPPAATPDEDELPPSTTQMTRGMTTMRMQE